MRPQQLNYLQQTAAQLDWPCPMTGRCGAPCVQMMAPSTGARLPCYRRVHALLAEPVNQAAPQASCCGGCHSAWSHVLGLQSGSQTHESEKLVAAVQTCPVELAFRSSREG